MHPCNKSNKLKECVGQSQVCSWAKWPMQWSPSQFTQHEANSSIMTTPWRKCKSIARLPPSTSSQVSLAMQLYPSLLLDGERYCENKVFCPRNNTIIQPGLAHRTGMISGSECTVFSKWKSYPPSLILMTAEGWGEKEIICTKWVSDRKKLGKGWEWWSEYYYYDY